MPEKYATTTASQEYLQRYDWHRDKVRSFDGVTVSALGVGTYLGAADDATDRLYEDALVCAGQSGINIFDTAVNYRCQRSEKNIAYALRKLAGLGVARDQIFVSTKGGFLPAEGSAEGFREFILKCYLNTGIITPDDIVANCHCMTPAYLKSQINLSLANLKVDTIDLYYLHNPETQLQAVTTDEFYQRLTKAFAVFEEAVAAGKIKRYGIATWNGFREAAGSTQLLDFEKILACARAAAGSDAHHFKAIQLPYNVAMLEAVGMPNQKSRFGDLPAIAAAAYHGVGAFVSAPLMQGRLGSPRPPEVDTSLNKESLGRSDFGGVHKVLQFVASSPGVTSVMVGMKTRSHVLENGAVLRQKNLSVSELQGITKQFVRT